MTSRPQVSRAHYFDHYDTEQRFVSYWHQIRAVQEFDPGSVLEVGPGNGTVTTYLRSQGVDVTTADIAPDLAPDVMCSVTGLPFESDEFDVILCAEVLEHLPFDQFRSALTEIHRATRKGAVITLPHFGATAELIVKLPLMREKRIALTAPYPRRHHFDGQHYWEIGKRGYPLTRVLAEIDGVFSTSRHYLIPRNSYHMMIICRK